MTGKRADSVAGERLDSSDRGVGDGSSAEDVCASQRRTRGCRSRRIRTGPSLQREIGFGSARTRTFATPLQ
eukprot:2395904-Rhodomonas_salina.2